MNRMLAKYKQGDCVKIKGRKGVHCIAYSWVIHAPEIINHKLRPVPKLIYRFKDGDCAYEHQISPLAAPNKGALVPAARRAKIKPRGAGYSRPNP